MCVSASARMRIRARTYLHMESGRAHAPLNCGMCPCPPLTAACPGRRYMGLEGVAAGLNLAALRGGSDSDSDDDSDGAGE